MTRELRGLCQSGQTVAVGGTYEMIGFRWTTDDDQGRAVIFTLHSGEFFPDFDGRAVCWFLVKPLAESPTNHSALVTPWQINTEIH